jgi:hypothetical protein
MFAGNLLCATTNLRSVPCRELPRNPALLANGRTAIRFRQAVRDGSSAQAVAHATLITAKKWPDTKLQRFRNLGLAATLSDCQPGF